MPPPPLPPAPLPPPLVLIERWLPLRSTVQLQLNTSLVSCDVNARTSTLLNHKCSVPTLGNPGSHSTKGCKGFLSHKFSPLCLSPILPIVCLDLSPSHPDHKKVQCLPNPCIFSAGGMVLGVSSYDIVKELLGDETSIQQPGTKPATALRVGCRILRVGMCREHVQGAADRSHGQPYGGAALLPPALPRPPGLPGLFLSPCLLPLCVQYTH